MDPIPEQIVGLEAIAIVALVALFMGLLLVRLSQPPIVGYILAGILLGPTGLGLIHHSEAITLLAELGVLLLLFLIGMEISIRAFVLVLRPAVTVALGQLAVALAITSLFGFILDWSVEQILLFGFVVAVSSTAVAIKILEDIGELRTEIGRITVGVMAAQDIAIVPMLILAEAFGKEEVPALTITVMIGASVGVLGLLIWYLSRPGKIKLPFSEQLSGKPDLIALAALAGCLTAATVSSLFGLSPVYGAFVAGLILANSTLRAEAIEVTYPIQSILVFIFFLSIGLLIDLNFIFGNWPVVVSFALVVVGVKSALNVFLIRATGFTWDVALPAGLAMAQIGEFSFILAAVGLRNGVLDIDAYRLALSIVAVTLIISPVWMVMVRRFHDVTTLGLSSLREVLSEAYSDELAKGRNAIARAAYRGAYLARATRDNISKKRNNQEGEDETPAEVPDKKVDPTTDSST